MHAGPVSSDYRGQALGLRLQTACRQITEWFDALARLGFPCSMRLHSKAVRRAAPLCMQCRPPCGASASEHMLAVGRRLLQRAANKRFKSIVRQVAQRGACLCNCGGIQALLTKRCLVQLAVRVRPTSTDARASNRCAITADSSSPSLWLSASKSLPPSLRRRELLPPFKLSLSAAAPPRQQHPSNGFLGQQLPQCRPQLGVLAQAGRAPPPLPLMTSFVRWATTNNNAA